MGAAIAVVVVILLAYLIGVYLPSQDVVRIGGGSWTVSGSANGPVVPAGCGDCGRQLKPGAVFTIDVSVTVGSASCSTGFFGGSTCPAALVESISLDAPYQSASIAPSNFPYAITEGQGFTWAVTLTAPGTAGHAPVGGLIYIQPTTT